MAKEVKELKELRKSYNGAVFQFKPPVSSSKSIHKICNTASMPKGLTSEKIIRDIRKE